MGEQEYRDWLKDSATVMEIALGAIFLKLPDGKSADQVMQDLVAVLSDNPGVKVLKHWKICVQVVRELGGDI